MECCLYELRSKEVINSKNACKIGNVCDVQIDCCTGKVAAIIVAAQNRTGSLIYKKEELRIRWEDISVIGEDTILVCFDYNPSDRVPKKKGILDGLFR